MAKASDLRSLLAVDQTRAGIISTIVAVYQDRRNLSEVADSVNCSRRTLERLMTDFPELGQAIDKVRADNRAMGWQ